MLTLEIIQQDNKVGTTVLTKGTTSSLIMKSARLRWIQSEGMKNSLAT